MSESENAGKAQGQQFVGSQALGLEVQSVPTICPSFAHSSWTSNECMIVLSRPNPLSVTPGGAAIQPVQLTPLAVLHMSPQTAKDLYLVLKTGLDGYEKEWGEIKTSFSAGPIVSEQ